MAFDGCEKGLSVEAQITGEGTQPGLPGGPARGAAGLSNLSGLRIKFFVMFGVLVHDRRFRGYVWLPGLRPCLSCPPTREFDLRGSPCLFFFKGVGDASAIRTPPL